MNIKYLLSTRFTEYFKAFEHSLVIVKVFVDKMALPDDLLHDLLVIAAELKAPKHLYETWTACIGAFMSRMGAYKFFRTLPLGLIEYDLNSLTYAQDSRSWVLPLISQHLKKDAHLDYFVEHFLPMVISIDKMRELESKQKEAS